MSNSFSRSLRRRWITARSVVVLANLKVDTKLVMDLGGLGAVLQAVQAKTQVLTVRVFNTHHVLLAPFEALGNTSLNMRYWLVGRAIAMQGFSILRTDNQLLTSFEPFGHLDVVVDAFGILASMFMQGKLGLVW